MATMTRQHFILLAASLRTATLTGRLTHAEARKAGEVLAETLASTNSAFDEERFLAAVSGR